MTFRPSRLDALLLLLTLIWGSNFTVIKKAVEEIPPIGFNLLRLLLASAVLMAALPCFVPDPGRAIRAIRRRDWIALVLLGMLGHCLYQIAFMRGIVQTSVANTSLIFGCSPVTVALLTAALGHEHVSATRWAGALLSAFGIYLAVGQGGTLAADSVRGDLWVVLAMLCWAIYTVAAAPLLKRHAPITVTALSMTMGTIMYAPFGTADLVGLEWVRVSASAWTAVVASSLLALVASYLIWYTAVQRLGSTRTAVYSNVVPLVAMAVAAIWLGEPITWLKLTGAAAVLAGVGLTRLDTTDLALRRPEI